MRVIAGSARGIPLKSLNANIRPTMDMVKGAIFSSLADRVPESTVLDLFAGTGSLGIEAMSRGAARAVLVEHHRAAHAVMRDNLQKTGLKADVVPLDVYSYLKRTAERGDRFDLIFADPPYKKLPGDQNHSTSLLEDPHLPRLLDSSGIFVLEHMPGAPLPETTAWEIIRRKRYGATELIFFQHAVPVE